MALPTPNGSRNFDGLTHDGRPVDFRFSSGWLTVERGKPGADSDDEMETVLSQQISPFGVIDIDGEQICDILGLTVQGRKTEPERVSHLSRGFDWTGQTTYWRSTHRMLPQDDAEILTRKISQTFPGSVMVQPKWGTALGVRVRQIKFFMNSDEMVSIGVSYDTDRLQRVLAAEEVSNDEFQSVFQHRIDFIRDDAFYADTAGKKFIDEKGANKLDLDYHVINHRKYRIEMEYITDDARAQSITNKLLTIITGYFCSGFDIVNLQTGAIIGRDLTDEEDNRSYSRNFKDWCLKESNRYLFVEILPLNAATDTPTFVGYRPLNTIAPKG